MRLRMLTYIHRRKTVAMYQQRSTCTVELVNSLHCSDCEIDLVDYQPGCGATYAAVTLYELS